MDRTLRVARHDVEYAVGSTLLRVLVGVFALLALLVAVLPGFLSEDPQIGNVVLWFLTVLSGLLVPIVAIVASYLAIAGERQSGRLKVLLSLPPTRRDVLAGKFLGRSVVVLGAVLGALAAAMLLSLAVYGTVPVASYAVVAALTSLLGLAFVGIAVGLSAAIASRQGAMALAVSAYVLFVAFWGLVVRVVQVILDRGLSIQLDPETLTFLRILSPRNAYGRLIDSVVIPDLLGQASGGPAGLAPVQTATAPVYLQDWFVVGLLLAWIVVPLALGYWRFEVADLS